MSGLFASRAEIGVAMVRCCAVACVLQVPTRLAGLAALQMVPSRGPVSLGIRSYDGDADSRSYRRRLRGYPLVLCGAGRGISYGSS